MKFYKIIQNYTNYYYMRELTLFRQIRGGQKDGLHRLLQPARRQRRGHVRPEGRLRLRRRRPRADLQHRFEVSAAVGNARRHRPREEGRRHSRLAQQDFARPDRYGRLLRWLSGKKRHLRSRRQIQRWRALFRSFGHSLLQFG